MHTVCIFNTAAAAKSLQSCPTLCDPTDGSPPGSPVPGILQARTLEWVAISFSNAWKWKVKVKSLSRVWPPATPWTAAYQAPPSMGSSRQEYWGGLSIPSPGDLFRPGNKPTPPALAGKFFTTAAAAKSLQSCPTLCDPIDGSPPGSSVPGILQARTLEWVASSFSNAWKGKVKVKSFSRVRLFVTPRTAAYQAPPSMGSSSGLPLPSPFTTEPAVKPTQTSILITILLLQCLAHKWKERKWKKDGGREEKRQGRYNQQVNNQHR